MGEGGVNGTAGETYGSVTSPRENGAGGAGYGRGGGAVRIVAERVQIDGAIRASGESGQFTYRTGAGGSV